MMKNKRLVSKKRMTKSSMEAVIASIEEAARSSGQPHLVMRIPTGLRPVEFEAWLASQGGLNALLEAIEGGWWY